MKTLTIKDDPQFKEVTSPDYNYIFFKSNGYFARWGKTIDENPLFSPLGAELLDIEISSGSCSGNCPFCYKSNGSGPVVNMSFETFKRILDSMPPVLTQVAFGITGVQTNPDFIRMMEYTRSKGYIPNFTTSGLDVTQEFAEQAARIVGGLAVSAYQTSKEVCYGTVKMFTDLKGKNGNTLKSVVIHLLVSKETMPFVYEVLEDVKKDKRLCKINAVVFLTVKPKGRAANNFHCATTEEYDKLIQHCFDNDITFGMDSCSSPRLEHTIKKSKLTENEKKRLIQSCDSCESFGLFSFYINVHGVFFPCSFCEGEKGWKSGISMLEISDFMKDVWYSEKLDRYRQESIKTAVNGTRKCLIFEELN